MSSVPVSYTHLDVYKRQEERQAAGVLDRQSLVQLLLTPLMSGEMARKERILRSLKMIRGEQEAVDEAEKRQMESVLYALAMKFLTKEELEEVWEVFRMTVLGEILVEHGKEIGIAEGRSQGIEEGRTQGCLLYTSMMRWAYILAFSPGRFFSIFMVTSLVLFD